METRTTQISLSEDVESLLRYLRPWSSKGIQAFIESGLLTDLVETVRVGDLRSDLLYEYQKKEEMFMQSRDRGSVTLPQFKRFLDVVPKTKTGFDRFIEVLKIGVIPQDGGTPT